MHIQKEVKLADIPGGSVAGVSVVAVDLAVSAVVCRAAAAPPADGKYVYSRKSYRRGGEGNF